MAMKIFAILNLFFLISSYANDGVGGMNAGSLFIDFNSGTKISLESEILKVSQTKIEIDCIFHNKSKKDEEHLIVFPLPDYDCSYDTKKMIHDFTTRIEEKKIKYETEEKIINNDGKDITKEVKKLLGVVTCKDEIFQNQVARKIKVNVENPQDYKFKEKKDQHFSYFSNDDHLLKKFIKAMNLGYEHENSGEQIDFPWGPNWKLQIKHHFKYTFKGSQKVNIKHHYTPSLGENISFPNRDIDYKNSKWFDYAKTLTKKYSKGEYRPDDSRVTYLEYI